MTSLFLEIIFALPTVLYLIEDYVDLCNLSLQWLKKYGWLKVILPFIWAWLVFVYRWVYLTEDLNLIMIIQLSVGAITTLSRWSRRSKHFDSSSNLEVPP